MNPGQFPQCPDPRCKNGWIQAVWSGVPTIRCEHPDCPFGPLSVEEDERAIEENVFARALAEMPMPEYGVGTAWPAEVCPFCDWEGDADRTYSPEKQAHEADCPIRLARSTLESK